MYRTISSLRFKTALNAGVADTFYYAAFTNCIQEYVFSIPREVRGSVESIGLYPYLNPRRTETPSEEIVDRVACVCVRKGGRDYYFYVFAEVHPGLQEEWKITGRSFLMEGELRSPDYEKEMIWCR